MCCLQKDGAITAIHVRSTLVLALLLVVACAAGCEERWESQGTFLPRPEAGLGFPTDASVIADARVEARPDLPGFCGRADDAVTELFCGAEPPAVTSLSELETQLGMRTPVRLLLGHSTGLDGRLVSAINPRAVLLRFGCEAGIDRGAARRRLRASIGTRATTSI